MSLIQEPAVFLPRFIMLFSSETRWLNFIFPIVHDLCDFFFYENIKWWMRNEKPANASLWSAVEIFVQGNFSVVSSNSLYDVQMKIADERLENTIFWIKCVNHIKLMKLLLFALPHNRRIILNLMLLDGLSF